MNFLQNHKFMLKPQNLFFLTLLTVFFSFFSTPLLSQKTYTIVLDAGHGGKDPGNLGNGFQEKDIALKTALEVGRQLSKFDNIKVIYTRQEDVFIDLWKRGAIANDSKATLFVSFHCDSHTSNAYGAGTFVLGLRGNKKNFEIAKRENAVVLLEDNYQERYQGFDPNSAESVIGLSLLQEENLDKSLEIATLVQQNFTQKLNRLDRKVKQDNFQVLRETIMPSILIELGFLTNRAEGAYLNSEKGQSQMAKAIADAIKDYIDHLRMNTVNEVKTPKIISEKTNNEVVFKIQIASGKNKIELKPSNFSGLKDVEIVQTGDFFKYYYGTTSNYKEAQESLKTAQKAGFSTAFMVAFKGEEKISVAEALKLN
ncbi:N-acetylmuramoyl-L-alanine amidase [Polaribacter sp. BAL334]|nr:N-acetylmuramoyl-L-alanine amidase [Polaribacter sp. BAL334]